MFKKLLKYDFKWIFSIWWIGAVSILVLSVPAGFALRNLVTANYTQYGEIFNGLWVYLYYILLCLFPALGSVLIFIRYYCNFFRDEGYLTFTLPVKRSTHLLSKVVSGSLINLLSGITIFIAVCIIGTIMPMEKGSSMTLLGAFTEAVFEGIWECISKGDLWFILYFLLIMLISVAGSVLSTILTYLFITIGATVVKKHKVLATIGIMYASSFVASLAFIPILILVVIWFGAATSIANFGSSILLANCFVCLLLLFVLMALICAITLIYSIITGTLERKLNLQ